MSNIQLTDMELIVVTKAMTFLDEQYLVVFHDDAEIIRKLRIRLGKEIERRRKLRPIPRGESDEPGSQRNKGDADEPSK